jgi:hypothetical protein
MKSASYTLSALILMSVLYAGVFQQKASATTYTFKNVVNAQQEVPPSLTSIGKGTVDATYNDATKLLSYTVTYSNLAANSTAAHFHGPALPGANAGVQVGIAITTGTTSGTKSATATLTVTQEAQLLAGMWYFNIHNSAFPGGEIRGQLIPQTTFNLKVIPQGFFNTSTLQLNQGDSVKVYARNSSSPYALKDSAKSVLNVSTFDGMFAFNQLYTGNYFLEVRHRNSIKTWSASATSQTMGTSSFVYDFTNDQSKAYGNNQIKIYPPSLTSSSNGLILFGIYGGDVNQDGVVDAGDLSYVENDVAASASGYVISDLTGDDFVDAGDLSIVENNASAGVASINP